MQTIFTGLKVNNEIELCEIADEECKNQIEKELLKNRISYFIRWQKKSIFSKRERCIICVNDNVKEEVAEIVQAVCDEMGGSVRFIMRKSANSYL